MTVYVSIGNSDDKLTQKEWSEFYSNVDASVRDSATCVYGAWLSSPESRWQNACWCFEVLKVDEDALKSKLVEAAHNYRQDSIAWAEAPETEFL